MTLLQPSYLWGLLAIGIPIAIHLWSRKKVQIVVLGSTQFITETKSKQTNSIQINEWWLLLLRCLVISMLVFILAEPHSTVTPNAQAITYIFEPALLATQEGQSRFKQIPNEGRLLLSDGFPEWEAGAIVSAEVPNYWQLAMQMEKLPSDSIVVFTQAFLSGVKGKRPKLKKSINWISVDLESEVDQSFLARFKNDSIVVTSVQSDEDKFAFAKAVYPQNSVIIHPSKDSVQVRSERSLLNIALKKSQPIEVTIALEAKMAQQLSLFTAGLRAISGYLDQPIEVREVTLEKDSQLGESPYLIWLSTQEMPQYSGRTLRYKPDGLAQKIIAPGKTRSDFVLTKELTASLIVEEQWVEQLLEWLALDQELQEDLTRLDKRKVSPEQLQSGITTKTAVDKNLIRADLSGWLWGILFILILGERLIALVRKQ